MLDQRILHFLDRASGRLTPPPRARAHCTGIIQKTTIPDAYPFPTPTMKPLRCLLLLSLLLLTLSGPLVSAQATKTPAIAPVLRFYAGDEFPGAKGSVKIIKEGDSLINSLEFDFTGGGAYVAGRHSTDLPEGFTELQIKVRSAEPRQLGIRLVDDAGQCHQFKRTYEGYGEWAKVTVDLIHFRPDGSWGGPNDKKLHFPIREIHFLVAKDRQQPTETQKGSVDFGEVVAVP